jgi:hypothetical protein
MKYSLFIVLVVGLSFSCRTHSDTKNKLLQQTDSLLTVWNETFHAFDLQSDSLLYIQNITKKNKMLQIMAALKKDTLGTDDIQTMENFFAAFDCYENNYFNLKKIKYFSIFKKHNLQHLRSDIANDIIYPEAADKFIQHEKTQLGQLRMQQSQLSNEYGKCKGLISEFFRDAMKMYARYHKGNYPSFFNDSLPDVP